MTVMLYIGICLVLIQKYLHLYISNHVSRQRYIEVGDAQVHALS